MKPLREFLVVVVFHKCLPFSEGRRGMVFPTYRFMAVRYRRSIVRNQERKNSTQRVPVERERAAKMNITLQVVVTDETKFSP